MLEALKEQIKKTTTNLERGTPTLSDRIFLNHILDELDFILNATLDKKDFPLISGQMYDLAESTCQMLGSTNELVEDGLE